MTSKIIMVMTLTLQAILLMGVCMASMAMDSEYTTEAITVAVVCIIALALTSAVRYAYEQAWEE